MNTIAPSAGGGGWGGGVGDNTEVIFTSSPTTALPERLGDRFSGDHGQAGRL